MYVEGFLKSGKTSLFVEKYIELIKSGISTGEILIVCANSYKKRILSDKIKGKLVKNSLDHTGNVPVFTFNGIVYNTVQNNWPIIEEKILKDTKNSVIIPNLCGLETTEYILKNCIKDINEESKDEIGFKDYYSDLNLIHQLLRRYRLFTENNLAEEEITAKSEFLKENFAKESMKVLEKLKEKSGKVRSIDYLKQTEFFHYLVENNLINDFNKIKYLFADDIDELSYSAQNFIKYLMLKVNDFYLAADPNGGTRRGYLCANPEGWEEIKQVKNSEIIKLNCKKPVFKDAESLYTAVKDDLKLPLTFISYKNSIKKIEMLENVLKKIENLIYTQKVSPEDIIIVSPSIDENTKYALSDFFKLQKIKYQFLSGSKKIIENPYVHGSLIIAQLINEKWKFKPSEFEIRLLLTGLLNFPMVACGEIIQSYKTNRKKLDENIILPSKELDYKYRNLISTIKYLQDEECNLQEQLSVIFTRILAPELDIDSDIQDFNIMLKSLKSFYEVINRLDDSEKPKIPEKDWIIQIKNTVVSDNPPLMPHIKENSILISTPQKVVDFELESKYQIWLDVSGGAWTKDDTGPLYNSWVFQKNWQGEEYSPEIHRKLTLNKTAHVLRKLVICANEAIFTYSSQLDNVGNENTGILVRYLDQNTVCKVQDFKRITPRKDQEPIVKYTGGKLAVPAVPGAGKTTIMQALIIELLKKNVKPSEIMVITYMESAARNFLDKIKRNCPNLNEMPYISTIHGLAYRILLDDDNYIKLGFDQNLEICDDTAKVRIIQEICLKYMPMGENEYNWTDLNTRAISKSKLGDLHYTSIKKYLNNHSNQQLEEFLPIYTEYCRTLREKNMVDFDDLLVNSVKLLKNYPEIRRTYQIQYRYVIEDEAQDSSKVQQDLISIISSYHGNLVRCGDPNQAIMNTFTNADVEGFRDFIANNQSINMVSSQRCAKEIYELANDLVRWSYMQENLKKSFLEIYMEPVEGKNLDINNSVNLKIYDSPDEEKIRVLNEIKKLREENPDYTFGILLKKNDSVVDWARFLESHNIPVICYTDSLKQKKVFRFILSFLQVIENPFENKNIVELYEEFIQLNFYRKDFESIDFIKNKIKSPFISFGLSDLMTQNLVNFWADIYYWLEYSYLPPEELIVSIGNYYFKDIIDKSNIYLIAALVKKFKNSFNNYEETAKTINLPEIIAHFKKLKDLKRVSGVKFFTEQDEDSSALAGYVQLMTIHKSKGNEFDAVFIPEMHESMYNYTITPENIQIKSENILLEKINELVTNRKEKNSSRIQLDQVEENMRVIYVGITRAKKKLYMSSTTKLVNKWGKVHINQPSKVLEYFISLKQPKLQVVEYG